jgi:phage terminase small subunit
VGDSAPHAPKTLSTRGKTVWRYYVQHMPALRGPDRDVLAVFCESVVLCRDLHAALADVDATSADAMRLRRDLRGVTAEVRQLSDRLGFNPKAREHLTVPEPSVPDLEDWMR